MLKLFVEIWLFIVNFDLLSGFTQITTLKKSGVPFITAGSQVKLYLNYISIWEKILLRPAGIAGHQPQ